MSNKKEEVQSSILLAVSCGESEKVEQLINQYGLLSSTEFCGGFDLLLNACLFGQKQIVKFLLEAGANVFSRISHADTALHYAAWFGDSDVAQLLLDHHALIDAKDQQYETALHLACRKGHENIARLLLDKGANPNETRELPVSLKKKFTHLKIDKAALLLADEKERAVRELLKYGAKVNPPPSENDLSVLCSGYVKRKSENEGNVTPLHLAAEMGHLKTVELLLNKGASVDPQTSADSTPLLLAVVEGHADVAEMLLQRGAWVHTEGDDNLSLLCIARQKGDLQMMRCLLDHGAIIDS